MPIYEYECPKCGIFEAVQKAGDKPLKAKPDCDCKDCPKKAKRIISASAFHLKGGGWYKTDYASNSSAGATKRKKSGESQEKSGTSSDSANSDTAKSDSGKADSAKSDSKKSSEK